MWVEIPPPKGISEVVVREGSGRGNRMISRRIERAGPGLGEILGEQETGSDEH